jgi:hypothetical protein
MMGRLSHDQEQFFYSFRLDEAVPEDHAVREVTPAVEKNGRMLSAILVIPLYAGTSLFRTGRIS